jgi:hypothetical protein
VVAGRTVDARISLRPAAAIWTTARDAVTGQPVQGACVTLARQPGDQLPDSRYACSDTQGRVRIGPLESGDYKLFVTEPQDSGYGRQWVGRNGGTGDPREARVVHAVAGRVASLPDIRLDKGGSITGRVTAKGHGKPVTSGQVSLTAWHPGVGPVQSVEIDAQGRYVVDHLGPYAWPLLFTTTDQPSQWSGGTANRFRAKKIKVAAGKATTYNVALLDGATVTGTTTTHDYILATNIETGDIVGSSWVDNGRYSMRVLGPQWVYLRFDRDKRVGPIFVPQRGTKQVNLPN